MANYNENMDPYGNVLSKMTGQYGVSTTAPDVLYGQNGIPQYRENLISNTDYKKFLGSNYGYLTDLIKGNIEGNNPIYDIIFGNAARRIGGTTSRNIRDVKENLAASGFRGTGANLINDAYRSEADALSQVSDSIAQMQASEKQNSINQLLGLNNQESNLAYNTNQSNIQQNQWLRSFLEGQRQFNENLNYQKENTPSVWEGILGSLLGAGAQVGSAALIGSDKSLKKNIKKVAETEEGIPVVKFNYKEGGKAEQIGFLSKDVKKKHPEAVKEVVDYSRVPMKISKLLAA